MAVLSCRGIYPVRVCHDGERVLGAYGTDPDGGICGGRLSALCRLFRVYRMQGTEKGEGDVSERADLPIPPALLQGAHHALYNGHSDHSPDLCSAGQFFRPHVCQISESGDRLWNAFRRDHPQPCGGG